jgi:hypothetical protein
MACAPFPVLIDIAGQGRVAQMKRVMKIGLTAGALTALTLLVAPAFGASDARSLSKPLQTNGLRTGIGSFTPAAADPRMAAAFARSGIATNSFRFTPSAPQSSRAVTVAVRAGSNRGAVQGSTSLPSTAAAGLSIAPVAYNLGVSVGWRRFALSGDVAKVDLAGLPGGRESANVGVSYNTPKWTTRLQLQADKPVGSAPRSLAGAPSYSADVSTSYSLTRNLNVTAGVRYKEERDRLTALSDTRRDSQAVYVGTAFRF